MPQTEFSSPPMAPVPELGVVTSEWNPRTEAPNATTHTGAAIPAEAVFPVSPPAFIGTIETAESTFGVVQKGAWKKRLGGGLGGLLLGAWIGLILFGLPNDSKSGHIIPPVFYLCIPVFAIVGAILGAFLAGRKAQCSFTGDSGFARYTFNARTRQIKKREEFRFADAVELRTTQIRQYYGVIYFGTRFNYEWRNDRGGRVFRLNGTFKKTKGLPDPEDAVHFALAAEKAWTNTKMAEAQSLLARGESVRFPLGKKDAVVLYPQSVALSHGSRVDQIERSEIGGATVEQGKGLIVQKGASQGFLGVGKTGVLEFSYFQLGNARLLYALLGFAIDPDHIASGMSNAPVVLLAQAAGNAQRRSAAVRKASKGE